LKFWSGIIKPQQSKTAVNNNKELNCSIKLFALLPNAAGQLPLGTL